MNHQQPSVVFIHGLWLHATSWQPWVDLFDEAGYERHRPGWPGDADTVEEARENPGRRSPTRASTTSSSTTSALLRACSTPSRS